VDEDDEEQDSGINEEQDFGIDEDYDEDLEEADEFAM